MTKMKLWYILDLDEVKLQLKDFVQFVFTVHVWQKCCLGGRVCINFTLNKEIISFNKLIESIKWDKI